MKSTYNMKGNNAAAAEVSFFNLYKHVFYASIFCMNTYYMYIKLQVACVCF